MGFLQVIKSLDDLLYEIVSWLVFYPLTLWRALWQPLRTMEYAASELGNGGTEPFSDSLNPPLFLLLSLLLSHTLELAWTGQSSLVVNQRGIARFVTDDTSLLLLRLVVFSIFPIVFSTRLVRKRRLRLTRDTLQAPFFGQCYLTGPFALATGAGTILAQLTEPDMRPVGAAIVLCALLWYGAQQARWFAEKLQVSLLRGLWVASVGMCQCAIAILLLVPLRA